MIRNMWKVLPAIAVIGINAYFVPSMHLLARNVEAQASAAWHSTFQRSCPMGKRTVVQQVSEEEFSIPPAAPMATLATWTPQRGETQEAPAMPEMPSINEQDIRSQVEGALQQVHELDDDDSSGWLGVMADEVTAEHAKDAKLTSERGVFIGGVQPGSPAEKAGLKKGDVILSFDQQNVEGAQQFRRMVRETPPGRTIMLTVWRDGRSQQISAHIGQHSEEEESRVFPGAHGTYAPLPRDFKFNFNMPSVWDFGGPHLGINAQDLNGQLAAYFGAPDGKGVLVTEVLPDSAAEKAGLKAGDVITRVGRKVVESTAELRQNLRGKAANGEVAMSILRRGSAMTLRVKLPKPATPDDPDVIQRVSL
jgi:serine protease Do